MAVIGGFRSDLSITRKTNGNFGTFLQVFCFPKSRINENGGKCYKSLVKYQKAEEHVQDIKAELIIRRVGDV